MRLAHAPGRRTWRCSKQVQPPSTACQVRSPSHARDRFRSYQPRIPPDRFIDRTTVAAVQIAVLSLSWKTPTLVLSMDGPRVQESVTVSECEKILLGKTDRRQESWVGEAEQQLDSVAVGRSQPVQRPRGREAGLTQCVRRVDCGRTCAKTNRNAVLFCFLCGTCLVCPQSVVAETSSSLMKKMASSSLSQA